MGVCGCAEPRPFLPHGEVRGEAQSHQIPTEHFALTVQTFQGHICLITMDQAWRSVWDAGVVMVRSILMILALAVSMLVDALAATSGRVSCSLGVRWVA
jgi:hypothetical protein